MGTPRRSHLLRTRGDTAVRCWAVRPILLICRFARKAAGVALSCRERVCRSVRGFAQAARSAPRSRRGASQTRHGADRVGSLRHLWQRFVDLLFGVIDVFQGVEEKGVQVFVGHRTLQHLEVKDVRQPDFQRKVPKARIKCARDHYWKSVKSAALEIPPAAAELAAIEEDRSLRRRTTKAPSPDVAKLAAPGQSEMPTDARSGSQRVAVI
jgi:hypothetical protein